MTGFGKDSTKDEKSSGIYAPLVDQYVRVLLSGSGVIVGRLSYTDHTKTQLQPHIAVTDTDLSDEARIVENPPAVVRTDAITSVIPLGIGKEYLEKIVTDAAEKNRMNIFKREKDLREKGYFENKE